MADRTSQISLSICNAGDSLYRVTAKTSLSRRTGRFTTWRGSFGDLERCRLRAGNVHSADGWKNVLEPVVARYRERGLRRYFRADAAFANPYEFLETEDYKYTSRLPANHILQDRIGYLLKRPVGRPPHHVRRYYATFRYRRQAGAPRAASWPRSSGTPASFTPRRLHRDEHEPPGRVRRCLLQQTRNVRALQLARFRDLRKCDLQESSVECLRNLENETRMPPGFLRLESMVIEATK
jgi:Transposase DDE domain group 1